MGVHPKEIMHNEIHLRPHVMPNNGALLKFNLNGFYPNKTTSNSDAKLKFLLLIKLKNLS